VEALREAPIRVVAGERGAAGAGTGGRRRSAARNTFRERVDRSARELAVVT
jgi:hypothetical protein